MVVAAEEQQHPRHMNSGTSELGKQSWGFLRNPASRAAIRAERLLSRRTYGSLKCFRDAYRTAPHAPEFRRDFYVPYNYHMTRAAGLQGEPCQHGCLSFDGLRPPEELKTRPPFGPPFAKSHDKLGAFWLNRKLIQRCSEARPCLLIRAPHRTS